jgi:uracil-DNA glycosylase
MKVLSEVKNQRIEEYLVQHCHADWKEILIKALNAMDKIYLQQLINNENWFPGKERLLAAFSMPLEDTRYILLGESPYPRKESANGYSFWDASVGSLWSSKGLSLQANKATSLRNLLKMLLVAGHGLDPKAPTQPHIAQIDKKPLVQTAEELFKGMMKKGILLLNACLVYRDLKVPYHTGYWKPFMHSLFNQLSVIKPSVQLILLGKVAEFFVQNPLTVGIMAEHPYNLSFVSNQSVIDFFKPLDLLTP